MTQRLPTSDQDDSDGGLNWPRIAGLSFVFAVHAAALLLLLAPVSPPGQEKAEEDVTRVVIIEPPPQVCDRAALLLQHLAQHLNFAL